jgi:CDP-2,3-bis-(O-geranylgeranyl)-sn-glycerol synthase
MDPSEVVVVALWAMLPAYLPNNVSVIAGGGRPIDGGRHWRGARLLGDGKTWRGLAAGTVAGVVAAVVLSEFAPVGSDLLGISVPAFPLAATLALPAGAVLGDVIASFVKRRTDRQRGASFPIVDQLDLVVGALGLTFLAAPDWAIDTFTGSVILAVVVLTPVLHLATNGIGYLLGLKNEPW